MNTQINIRLPEKLLESATEYADEHGFNNVQDLMKEALREKVLEEPFLTNDELFLIKKLARASEEKDLYGTEEELFAKLKRS